MQLVCHIFTFLAYPVGISFLNELIALKTRKCFNSLFLQTYQSDIKNNIAQKRIKNNNKYIFVFQIYYIYFHAWQWLVINRFIYFLKP